MTPDAPPTRLIVRAPGRLHFGLLAWGPDAPRQFGGVGLMIDRPSLEVGFAGADCWRAEGPLADRALEFARRVAVGLESRGLAIGSYAIRVRRAPPTHSGFGSGTSLGLTIARGLAERAGAGSFGVETLAELAGRGRRSGIGVHGFARGGLLVDGGHGPGDESGAPPPLVARLEFPAAWKVLIVQPRIPPGRSGDDEREAFRLLPPIPERVTDRLARLVLLGLLPAVAEADLPAFGAALGEIQRRVGAAFAPVQGGRPLAGPESEAAAARMVAEGLAGVGQSSWGPTLYGFTAEADPARLAAIRDRVAAAAVGADWAAADNRGHTLAIEEAGR